MKGGGHIFAALALATLAAAAPDLLRTLRASRERYALRRAGGAAAEDALKRQVAAAVPPGADLFFVASGDPREAPAEWAARQAAGWEMMPAPVRHGALDDAPGAEAILSPRFDDETERRLSAPGNGYRLVPPPPGVAETGRALRLRADLTARRPATTGSSPGAPDASGAHDAVRATPGPWREALGLAPAALAMLGGGLLAGMAGLLAATVVFSVLALLPALAGAAPTLAAAWTWGAAAVSAAAARLAFKRGGQYPGRSAMLAGALAGMAVMGLVAWLALAHSFAAPYGLAVSGGKAKLWYLARGILAAHFADPAWSVLEPAYPPGHPALAYGCYAAAGGCGDWLTQLLVCPFAALAAAFLVARADGLGRKAWAASLFLLPVALMPASQFYPDPIRTLLVLVGWERIRGGGGLSGWLFLGAAGWFKSEGAVFLVAAWLAWRLVGGGDMARLRDLAVAAALPALGLVGPRLAGARLNGYVAPWAMSPSRGLKALGATLRLAFVRPAALGFAYPAAVVAALAGWRRTCGCPPPLRAALAFAGISALAFAAIYACAAGVDLDWHLRTSLARLLWTPALVLAREAAE